MRPPPLILLLLLLLGCAPVRVARVIDGDTVVLADSTRVRLAGIDAPELEGKNPAGLASREYLRELVEGRRVALVVDTVGHDFFGRVLGYLYVDTLEVNRALVRAGHARIYLKYPFAKRAEYEVGK